LKSVAKKRLNLQELYVQCIMLILIMRVTQLRQADLNLLVVFSVLAEERNVSRAAKRLLLSQPAVSRALQRMRDTFHDDLLVRTAKGYEPTPQGERVLQELEVMLPRLDRLISGSTFDPATEHCSFRIAATDNATSIIAPVLCREVLRAAKQVRFTFATWRGDVFEDLSHGRLDLVLIGDEGHVPSPLLTEVIYEEELVCIVAADAPYQRQLTLKQYLAAEHIGVDVVDGSQNIPEKRLAAHGHRRRTVITLPYFGAATRCIPGTKLILTAPQRFARAEAENRKIKVLKAPAEITGFKYLMIWHPRVNTDAAHAWLRGEIRRIGKTISS
jgi:DNA-binding transcriptional LysR family regulator